MSNGLIELILENGIELGVPEAVNQATDGTVNDYTQDKISDAISQLLSEAAEDAAEDMGDIFQNPTMDKADDALEALGRLKDLVDAASDILDTLNRDDISGDEKAARALIDIIEKLLPLSGDPSAIADAAIELRQRMEEELQRLFDENPDIFEDYLDENGLPIPKDLPPPSDPSENPEAPPSSPNDPNNFVPPTAPSQRPTSPDMQDVPPQTLTPRTEGSPLVLDLGDLGIELTSLEGPNAVYWDIDQDGMAEASGWVGPQDGLLALDRNGDGIITDHTELFGTESIDGFIVLSELDSNGDGVIDVNDTAFENLIVWVDANTDGYSQETELFSLTDLGIASIDLNFSVTNYEINGNTVRSESSYTMTDGTERQIVDAWFAYDNFNTVYAQEFTFDIRTMFLPTIRGYGNLPDLHIAMSIDNGEGGLLDLVKEIALADVSTLFSSNFGLEDKIKEILFTWAGVQDVSPTGRGAYIDGRELAFLEQLTDMPFAQRGNPSPYVEAAGTLKNAFNDAYNSIAARLLVQAVGSELFTEVATYNLHLDIFEGTFVVDFDTVETTIDTLELSDSDLTEAWNNMIRLIDHTVGLDNLSSGDMVALEAMITESDPASTLTLQDVLDTIYEPIGLGLNGTEGDDTLIGGAGNDSLSTSGGDDVIYGRQGNDSINGGTGNDDLYGEEGHDNISGGNGNDYLAGGVGDDTLQGGYGNDTYYYESGIDTIRETSGYDTVVFDSAITPAQISIDFSETNRDDIYIYVDGSLAIRIENYFSYNGGAVEYLSFSDGTIIELSDLTGLTEGSAGDDTLVGNDSATFPHDTLSGLDGNDTLDGGIGNDVLKGGRGDDTYLIASGTDVVSDTAGTDKIIFGAGLDSTDVSYEVDSDGYMYISFNGTRYATIENQFTSNGSIETLEFDDGITVQTSALHFDQSGTSSAETIYGYRYGADVNNVIYAGAGNDRIYAYEGDDTVYGEAGNDRIYASSGNDTLDGGAGDDYLDGSTGNDTYIVTAGVDTISDSGGTDKIIFGSAYDIADMTFGRSGYSGNDLNIYFGGVLAATVSYHFNSSDSIETLEFSDGTTFSLASYANVKGLDGNNDTLNGIDDAYLEDDHIFGYSGNDTLNGGAGDDVLEGGSGDDILNGGDGADELSGDAGDDTLDGGVGDDYLDGGSGEDTYIYSGDGDTFHDNGSQNETDVISFGAGISSGDITLTRVDRYDLQIDISGSGSILIENQFNKYDQIETLLFNDSSTIDLLDVVYTTNGTASGETLYGTDGGAKSDIINGGAGNDTIHAYDGDDTINGDAGDDNIYAGDGNDIVNGGLGADDLYGGYGDDTYLITDAGDLVRDDGGSDTIVFDSSYSINDLELARSGNSDLIISFNGTPALTISNQFTQNGQIETLEFSDSSTFDLLTQNYTVNGDANNNYIYGVSYGGNPDDTLNGGDGNDTLYGYLGDDILDGGAGDDNLYGGDGDDSYYVGTGVDTISDTGGNDTIYLGAGFVSGDMTYERSGSYNLDIYFSGQKKMTLLNHLKSSSVIETLVFADNSTVDLSSLSFVSAGTENNDTLHGANSPGSIDEIAGLAGNDRIYGHAGDDTLIGGTGSDTLYGGYGDDTYIIHSGDGSDIISENANEGTNTIHLTGGVKADDIRLWTDSGGDLHIENEITGDTIEVYAGESNTNGSNQSLIGQHVEQIVFDDGTIWDLTDGLNIGGTASSDTLYGTAQDDNVSGYDGNDQLYGNSGADTINGGTGNDTLYGGLGDDSYIFKAGDGNDVVSENANEGTNTIYLTGGIKANDVRLWTDTGGDLHVENKVTGDSIEIYAGESNTGGSNQSLIEEHIAQIIFDDGTTWDLTNGLNLDGSDNADTLYGTSHDDILAGHDGNDQIYGNSGNDTLSGGLGNDTLYGGLGDDSYIIYANNGTDIISENMGEGTDTIHFADGVLPDDLRLWTDTGGDLHIVNKVTGDQVEVYAGESNIGGSNQSLIGQHIERITFDNGVVWDLTQALNIEGSTAADTLYGTTMNDTIAGMDGNDQIYGNSGNDIIYGNKGNDTLYGGLGDDTYTFHIGSGSDIISENANEGTNIVRLSGGILAQNIRLWTDTGGDLHVENKVTGDSIEIYAGESNTGGSNQSLIEEHIAQIIFDDGTTWDLTNGLNLDGSDNADTLYGTSHDDIVSGHGGNDQLYANSGNDTLDGGAGNDSLYGGLGDDTYVFQAGYGSDLIYENIGEGTDTLLITGDILPGDVRTWVDSGEDLHIRIITTGDEIEISGSGSVTDIGSRFEMIVFDNGTIWDLTQGLSLDDLDTSQTVYGSDQDDIIHGNGGNDQIYGYGGDDLLQGGDDDDYIYGGFGHDILYGGDGYDRLYGNEGADTFVFEAGSAFNDIDMIYDFDLADGDAIDITSILTGNYTPSTDSITDFVKIVDSGNDSLLQIDQNGGGDNFVTIATLDNITGLTDEQSLLDNGYLIFQEAGNTAPVTQNDNFTGDEDQIISGNVLSDNGNGADSDPDADNLTVQAATVLTAQGFSVSIASDGSFSYTPHANFYGQDSFDYIVLDGHGGRTIGTAQITVNSVNDNPIAVDDDINGAKDEVTVGNLLSDNGNGVDSDIENDTLSVQAGTFTTAQGGTIVVQSNGDFSYTPNTGFTGDDSFDYTLLDDQGGSDTGTLNLHIVDAAYNLVTGTSSNESLYGTAGRDYIEGKEGNDNLYGYDGNDVYVWNLGDGSDDIIDAGGIDRIELGDGISETDIRLWNPSSVSSPSHLHLYIGSTYIDLEDQFDGTGETIETVLLDDGTEIDLVNNLTFTGTNSGESVYGMDDNNVMIGLEGNDNLYGGNGDDVYIWNLGDGSDDIIDTGGADRIEFGEGITEADIRLWNPSSASSPSHLHLYVDSTYIDLEDQFDGTGEVIETALLDDGTEIDLLNNLTFTGTTSGESVYGWSDNNTMIGGQGNDNLYGGDGNDTYVWNLGDGSDDIIDTGGVDNIEFGEGITLADIRLWNPSSESAPSHLHLYVGSTYIDLEDQFDGTGESIETAIFSDTSTLDLLNNLTFTGTSSGETVYGTGGNDVLYGLDGGDALRGGAGDDMLYGGDGTDQLYGQAGADTFVFEADSAFNNTDVIKDYNAVDGDVINIVDLLTSYDPMQHAIDDFVILTETSGDTIISVDRDGTGTTYTAQDVVNVDNATGLDLDDMITNGELLVV